MSKIRKKVYLTADEVKFVKNIDTIPFHPVSANRYRLRLNENEILALNEFRNKVSPVLPTKEESIKWTEEGDYYRVISGTRNKLISKDRLREMLEVYTTKGMTINKACLQLRMTRADFMFYKNAFHFVKDDSIYPECDFSSDDISLDEMTDYARMKKKLDFFEKFEKDKQKDIENRIKILDTSDYWQRKAIEELSKIQRADPNLFPTFSPTTKTEKEYLVVVFGDAHTGLRINSKSAPYNYLELAKRFDIIRKSILDEIYNKDYEEVCIVDLGDFISGTIHDSLKELNELSNTESIKYYASLIEQLISSVRIEKPVSYFCVNGNHDRIEPNKSASTAENNYGNILRWYLKSIYKDILSVNIGDCHIETNDMLGLKLFDYYIGVEHGDKGKFLDAPNYFTSIFREIFKEIYRGHVHHRELCDVNGTLVESFPSLCGVDEYALSIRKVSKPGFALIGYNKDGRVFERIINF